MKGIDPVTGRDGQTGASTGLLDWSSDADDLDFLPEPEVTPHDVLTALGPDAEALMEQANVDVDELIRLINAETTMLPPIVLPTEASGEASGEQAEAGQDEDGLVGAIKTWKRRFLRGTVLAVMITLTGGGAAALAMNKSVTVDVDGERQTVRSYGDTVGEVLEDAGIEVGPTTPCPRRRRLRSVTVGSSSWSVAASSPCRGGRRGPRGVGARHHGAGGVDRARPRPPQHGGTWFSAPFP